MINAINLIIGAMEEGIEHGGGKLKKKLTIVGCLILATGSIVAFVLWHQQKPQSLLPPTIADQIVDFTPYFFLGQIPDGYSLNTKNVSFDQNIMIIPIKASGGQTLVVTEQHLPDNLPTDLQQEKDSEKVQNTAAPAFINKVEGRLVGIMISQKDKVLLIVNAPDSVHADIVAKLLQALKPVH